MMCQRCRKNIDSGAPRCPYCGHPNSEPWELYQTSTVLIAAGRTRSVYRSVEDVPQALRNQLVKSTNSSNSATVLIADRRGRQEIARAMRSLPGPSQRRLMRSILGAAGSRELPEWLTPVRRRAIIGAVVLAAAAVIGMVFTHTW
jgi:hypothetical protein